MSCKRRLHACPLNPTWKQRMRGEPSLTGMEVLHIQIVMEGCKHAEIVVCWAETNGAGKDDLSRRLWGYFDQGWQDVFSTEITKYYPVYNGASVLKPGIGYLPEKRFPVTSSPSADEWHNIASILWKQITINQRLYLSENKLESPSRSCRDSGPQDTVRKQFQWAGGKSTMPGGERAAFDLN